MSEWGIEQKSTFNNVGGCAVEALSWLVAIGLIVMLVHTSPFKNPKNTDKKRARTESIQPPLKPQSTQVNMIRCNAFGHIK